MLALGSHFGLFGPIWAQNPNLPGGSNFVRSVTPLKSKIIGGRRGFWVKFVKFVKKY